MGGEADLPIAVSVDGVTVEKRLNPEHPDHLAVVFDVRSDRQDSARLRISDPVPSRFPVGFHPEFGGKHWSISSDGVEFTRGLDPGERLTTVYAVGNVTESDRAELAVEPVVELQEGIDSPVPENREATSEAATEAGLFDDFQDLDEEISFDEMDTLDAGNDFDDESTEQSTQPSAPQSDPGKAADRFDLPNAEPADGSEGDADGRWPVTVALQNVTVEKRLDTEMFSFPAVVFEIISTADGLIEIRLEDTIPSSVSADDISFHHRYGDDHWEQHDHTVVFVGEIEPGETFTTLYAVRDLGATPEEAFLEEPTVIMEDETPGALGDPGGEDRSESQVQVDSEGDRDESDIAASEPPEVDDSEAESIGLRSDAADGTADRRSNWEPKEDAAAERSAAFDSTDPETLEGQTDYAISDPTEQGDDRPGGRRGDEDRMRFDNSSINDSILGGTDQEPSGETESTDSIAESNAPESEQSGAGGTGGDRKEGSGSGTPGWIPLSFRRTIRDLEEAVKRLEQSTAEEQPAIAAVQTELEALQSEFDTIRDPLETVATRSSDMESTLGDLEASLSSLQADLSAHDDDRDQDFSELYATLSDLAEEVSLIKSTLASDLETSYQLRSHVEGFETELAETGELAEAAAEQTSSISEGVASVLEELSEIRGVLDTNSEALTDLQSDQTQLRESLQSVREDVSDLDDRIGELESSISTYGTFFQRVKHAMLGEMSIRSKRQLDELPDAERELLRETETLPTTLVRGIGTARAKALETQLGITDIPTLAEADPEAVASSTMVTVDEALRFVETARALRDFADQ